MSFEDTKLRDGVLEALAKEMALGFSHPTEHIYQGVLKALHEGGEAAAEQYLKDKAEEYAALSGSAENVLADFGTDQAAKKARRDAANAEEAASLEERR